MILCYKIIRKLIYPTSPEAHKGKDYQTLRFFMFEEGKMGQILALWKLMPDCTKKINLIIKCWHSLKFLNSNEVNILNLFM